MQILFSLIAYFEVPNHLQIIVSPAVLFPLMIFRSQHVEFESVCPNGWFHPFPSGHLKIKNWCSNCFCFGSVPFRPTKMKAFKFCNSFVSIHSHRLCKVSCWCPIDFQKLFYDGSPNILFDQISMQPNQNHIPFESSPSGPSKFTKIWTGKVLSSSKLDLSQS